MGDSAQQGFKVGLQGFTFIQINIKCIFIRKHNLNNKLFPIGPDRKNKIFQHKIVKYFLIYQF